MTRFLTLAAVTAIGLAAGALLALMIAPANIVTAIVLAVLAVVLIRRQTIRIRRGGIVALVAAAVLAFVVTKLVAVGPLDRKVPQLAYGAMALDEVCDLLAAQHNVFVTVEDPSARGMTITFSTDREMTRLQLLQKLAHDSGTELRIGYCGVGDYPAFIRLRGSGQPPKA